MSITRAISIRQPFVELILRGAKTEEYRSRPTNIRERVYLYASLNPFDSDEEWAKVGQQPGQLPVGLILGSVEIVDCRPERRGDGYAYVLRDPVRFTPPLKPVNQPQPVFWRPEFLKSQSQGSRSDAGDVGSRSPRPSQPRRARGPAERFAPDADLAAIVGSGPFSQSKLVKEMWAYIVTNNLQDQRNKRMVNADEKLRRLFGKQRVSLFEMAGLLADHVRLA